MKIMLAIAPWDLWEEEEDKLYPLGLAYLAAVLEKKKHEVSLLNLTNTKWEDVKENVRERLEKEKPEIFGISILSNSRISALKLLKLVKETLPKTIILAGGVHTTCLYEQVLNHYPVDYAVLGEGELTTTELLKAIKSESSVEKFKKIKGIAFKDKGKVVKTLPRERIKDLDSLPFPKHDFFSNIIEKHEKAYMMTSRGCPFSCAFCPSSVHWTRMRIQRSAKNVFQEIKYLIDRFPNLKRIDFSDDEFVCDNKRVIDLCKMMIQEGIKLNWRCLARASSINDELVSWMKKAGCDEVAFGIESGSQRILDNIGKNVKIEQIVNAINICRNYGIKTICLFITGLPGEDNKSVNETISLIKNLKCLSEPAILIVYPGTRVYQLAKEKGQMIDDYWLSDNLVPLYTAENSKAKLWWWAFKTGFYSHLHSPEGNLPSFLNQKLGKKFKPHNFFRVFRRYVSDKV